MSEDGVSPGPDVSSNPNDSYVAAPTFSNTVPGNRYVKVQEVVRQLRFCDGLSFLLAGLAPTAQGTGQKKPTTSKHSIVRTSLERDQIQFNFILKIKDQAQL